MDCTIERDLASRFGIKGFPTLLHIKDGEVRKYTGSRTPDNFMSFAQGEWKSINFEPLPKAGEKSYSNMIEVCYLYIYIFIIYINRFNKFERKSVPVS